MCVKIAVLLTAGFLVTAAARPQSPGRIAKAALYGRNTNLKIAVVAIRESPRTARTFVVMSARDPSEQSQMGACHACSPQVGVAVLHQSDGRWVYDFGTQSVGTIGVWGASPTDISVLNLGTQEGLLLRQSTMHQGLEHWADLLLIERNSVDDVGGFGLGGNNGSCDQPVTKDSTSPCIEDRVKLSVIPRRGALSEIRLEKIGTDFDPIGVRSVKVHQLITYRFDGKRYIESSSKAIR
jgi:hypothetical protein